MSEKKYISFNEAVEQGKNIDPKILSQTILNLTRSLRKTLEFLEKLGLINEFYQENPIYKIPCEYVLREAMR